MRRYQIFRISEIPFPEQANYQNIWWAAGPDLTNIEINEKIYFVYYSKYFLAFKHKKTFPLYQYLIFRVSARVLKLLRYLI